MTDASAFNERAVRAALCAALLLAAAGEAQEPARWAVGSEHLTVRYWPEHDELARLAREVGAESLKRLEALLGVGPTGRIEVFIVRSQAEFDELTGDRNLTWVVGRALLAQRRVVVKPMGKHRLPKLLGHELAHIMLDERMGPAGHRVPRWLHEGIAKYASDDWTHADAQTIARASLADELLALDDLDAAFAGKPERVALAYAQSYTLVAYLASLQPAVGLGPLLDQLAGGRETHKALTRAYGAPVSQLERDWLEQTRTAYLPELLPVPSELVIGGAFLAAFGLAVILARRRSARIRRRMDEEERLRDLLSRVHAPGDDMGASGGTTAGPSEQP
jgi:hypothetical protein